MEQTVWILIMEEEMKCTNCGKKESGYVTRYSRNINGKMVEFIKKGESLCHNCCGERGLLSLMEINQLRKEQLKKRK